MAKAKTKPTKVPSFRIYDALIAIGSRSLETGYSDTEVLRTATYPELAVLGDINGRDAIVWLQDTGRVEPVRDGELFSRLAELYGQGRVESVFSGYAKGEVETLPRTVSGPYVNLLRTAEEVDEDDEDEGDDIDEGDVGADLDEPTVEAVVDVPEGDVEDLDFSDATEAKTTRGKK